MDWQELAHDALEWVCVFVLLCVGVLLLAVAYSLVKG
jgi:hypothetical protein